MKRISTLLVVGMLSGCATLTNDSTQPIHFVAPDCEPATIECTATNKRGVWPFEPPEIVHIRRSDDGLRIGCAVPGRRRYHISTVPSRIGAKIVASAIFLDFGIVDSITDYHREYPPQIVIAACDEN